MSIDYRRIEILDEAMVAVLRGKSPSEKVNMVFDANRTMRLLLAAHFQSQHPEWSEGQIQREIARRISRGSS